MLIDSYEWKYIDAMQGKFNAFHHSDYEITVERNLRKYRLLDGTEEYKGYESWITRIIGLCMSAMCCLLRMTTQMK